jgi:hypothetical protein
MIKNAVVAAVIKSVDRIYIQQREEGKEMPFMPWQGMEKAKDSAENRRGETMNIERLTNLDSQQ